MSSFAISFALINSTFNPKLSQANFLHTVRLCLLPRNKVASCYVEIGCYFRISLFLEMASIQLYVERGKMFPKSDVLYSTVWHRDIVGVSPGSWRVYREIYSILYIHSMWHEFHCWPTKPFNRMQHRSFHPVRRIIQYSLGNCKNLYGYCRYFSASQRYISVCTLSFARILENYWKLQSLYLARAIYSAFILFPNFTLGFLWWKILENCILYATKHSEDKISSV